MKKQLQKIFSKKTASTPQNIDIKKAQSYFQQGNQFLMAHNFDEAIANYQQAIQLNANFADAYCNLGVAFKECNRLDAAIDNYQKALVLTPNDAELYNNLGEVFYQQGNIDAAISCYEQALSFNPKLSLIYYNLGLALKLKGQLSRAIDSHQKALALNPNYIDAYYHLAMLHQEQGNLNGAIANYQKMLELNVNHREIHKQLGILFQTQNNPHKAIEHYNQAISLHPELVDEVYANLGVIFQEHNQLEIALNYLKKAFAVFPDHLKLLDRLFYTQLHCCDWTSYKEYLIKITEDINKNKPDYTPFHILALIDDPKIQYQCAQLFSHHNHPLAKTLLWTGQLYQHKKIRLAYLSADFHTHATAYLMAELFEIHDKSRFEVIAISFGINDNSAIRERLERSFDKFINVAEKTDYEIALLIRNLEIDIAIDLKGYTKDYRAAIFSYRPAPVQVDYLGYPGTMGIEYIDYVIADKQIIPIESQVYYSEKVVYLPDSYQVNDSKRKIAAHIPSRAEVNLPETGFIFCCFNNNYKITPVVFDIWMRLLNKIENSILWLLEDNATAAANLKKEAMLRGVNPERLIFAQRQPLENHLARQKLADLFLDTLPYNAHTTSSDALWAGLPVLTCMGHSFASRVAASLLNAVGLPELITYNLEEYEALAMKLATCPELLAEIRAKLAQNRQTYPLFNSKRFTQHIESAYITMWERSQRGEPPVSFSVPVLN